MPTLDEFTCQPPAAKKPNLGEAQSWSAHYRQIKAERRKLPRHLEKAYLLSATYDGEQRKAVLKLYDPKTGKIHLWLDNTGHMPYLLTSLAPEELKKIPQVQGSEGLDHFETADKLDPFTYMYKSVTRVVAKDPLTIGGKPSGSLRDVIPRSSPSNMSVRVWESDIKYYENFIYDRKLEPGMAYHVENGIPTPVEYVLSPDLLKDLERTFAGETHEFLEYNKNWVKLLESPVPSLRYAALDIEVESPTLDRVPDPVEAVQAIICVSTVSSDGVERVLLLRREGVKTGDVVLPGEVKVEYYDSEAELVRQVMEILIDYPVVVTFNGDEFDLRYLWRRAQNLGFRKEDLPIEMGREFATLTFGVHIDLYRFFFNRSIQIYAFDQKYREITLEGVSSTLLGKGKIPLEKPVSQLPYSELAAYCLRDSELTYELATFDNHLILKLTIALARIAKMPLEDITRQGVSSWIKSMMYNEHRKRGILIPTPEEILEQKGVTATTTAVIKGKKYRGAIVIEPHPGVNFNVIVLDFASLYPSIIKKWNLSYETIRCPHQKCKENMIPETSHWVCTEWIGLTSLLIGSLRDLRVNWYKLKAKDRGLTAEIRSWYSIVQRTLKVLLNASYGVFGAEHFALYCPPVAEATASIGRYAITSAIKKAQDLGIEVIYGDTDSVFLKNPSEEQIHRLIEWSKRSLGMELDVDKIYRYTVFSKRKKNYIGVYPEGNLDIKGLTGKKRNTPEFLKDAFRDMTRILSEVKSEGEFFKAKERIKNIVKECYTKLKNKHYSLDELAFTVVLGKNIEGYEKTTPQHVKALQTLPPEVRFKMGAGSVIRFVKVRKAPNVKLVELSNIDEVDTEKYVEHIKTTFEQVLEALDISFNEIIGVSRLDVWT